jgi:hypothetical protein
MPLCFAITLMVVPSMSPVSVNARLAAAWIELFRGAAGEPLTPARGIARRLGRVDGLGGPLSHEVSSLPGLRVS